MHRLFVLLFLPLSAVASGLDDDSCADTWEAFFESDPGSVVQCAAADATRAVVQEWVALDDAFGADAPPGVADCQSVDVIQRSGKAGESCTRYDQATLCRSASNPHRVTIERGDGDHVVCPGD